MILQEKCELKSQKGGERQKTRHLKMQSVFEALAILSGDDAHVLLTRQFNPALLQWAVAVQSKVRPPQVSKLLLGAAHKSEIHGLRLWQCRGGWMLSQV